MSKHKLLNMNFLFTERLYKTVLILEKNSTLRVILINKSYDMGYILHSG